MKKILQQAQKLVIPSQKIQNEKDSVAAIAFRLVDKEIAKYSEVVAIEFGGSYPKGTWLPEKADVDIFIKFKESVSEKKFTDVSKKIGFAALRKYKPYVRYSDHPYVEAVINKTKVNVVPCYQVKKGNWKSAADRSQFHTEFMLDSLSGQMKNDVRLLKRFLKNNKIYGAEIAQQGFSGYITEVLIWNYRNFESVIKAFSKIKQGEVIGKASKKFDTAITIIDPIDPNRNLAAAISEENIGKFILLCRAFLKKPSISFFKTQKSKLDKSIVKNSIIVKFDYKTRSPDIIWGQVKRASSVLAVQLDLAGFNVIRNSSFTDENSKAALLFLVESLKISDNYTKTGPEYFNERDSQSFISKNSKKSSLMWVNDEHRVMSLEKRLHNDIKKFLADLLTKGLEKSGIPKGLKNDIKKNFKIISGDKEKNKLIKLAVSELVSTDGAIFYSSK